MPDDLITRLAPLLNAINSPVCLSLPAEWFPTGRAERRAFLRNLSDKIHKYIGIKAASLDGAVGGSADDVDTLSLGAAVRVAKNGGACVLIAMRGVNSPRRLSTTALADEAPLASVLLMDAICVLFQVIDVNALDDTATLISRLGSQMPETPIEIALGAALETRGLDVARQASLGEYIVDFLVSHDAARVVVEADGREFHDAEKDAERDRLVQERHGLSTLRFTGSHIHRNAADCAEKVRQHLEDMVLAPPRYDGEGEEALDASQRAAVNHGNDDARVLAPAGSGKTKVIVNRMVKLLNDGVPPGSVLTLAFNRSAVEQMVERLFALGVPASRKLLDEDRVSVLTLNGFGAAVIKEGFGATELLSNKGKLRGLIEEVLNSLGVHLKGVRGEDPLGIAVASIARVKLGLEAPVDIEIEVPQPKNAIRIPLDRLWEKVRELQTSRKQITFDDQIFLAVDLLLREPVLRAKWQSRFHHVLVDEYQDLNPAQALLVRVLTAGRSTLFAVGDDDQCIYTWRHARVTSLSSDFERIYPDAKTHSLEFNYRCPATIIDASSRLIAFNNIRYPKAIRAPAGAPEGTIVAVGRSVLSELTEALCNFFKSEREINGRLWGEMVVMTRTKEQLLAAAVALDRNSIPRGALPSIRLYSTPVGRRLLCYLKFALRPWRVSGSDLAEIINRPNSFVPNVRVDVIRGFDAPSSKTTTGLAWQSFQLLAFGCPQQSSGNRHVLERLHAVEKLSLRTDLRHAAPVAWIDAVHSSFMIVKETDPKVDAPDEASEDILFHIIREDARGYRTIEDFIEHAEQRKKAEENGDDVQQIVKVPEESASPDGRVRLSTIHGAKGLEWPVVALFDVSEPISKPSQKPIDPNVEEERRVFYVGMTRATRSLQISFVSGRPIQFVKEALIPKDMQSLDADGYGVWLGEQLSELKEIRGQIERLEKRLAEIRVELSKHSSVWLPVPHERELRRAQQLGEHWGARLENLLATDPRPLIRRLFFGGLSEKKLDRLIDEATLRSRDAKREIKEAQATIASKKHEEAELISELKLEFENAPADRKRLDQRFDETRIFLERIANVTDLFEDAAVLVSETAF